jgi:hypothetical protein
LWGENKICLPSDFILLLSGRRNNFVVDLQPKQKIPPNLKGDPTQ